jgi:hypothetical protein
MNDGSGSMPGYGETMKRLPLRRVQLHVVACRRRRQAPWPAAAEAASSAWATTCRRRRSGGSSVVGGGVGWSTAYSSATGHERSRGIRVGSAFGLPVPMPV